MTNCPKESDEQACLFEWAELESGKHPELKMMFAIPNGGSRHKLEAKNLKKQGVKAGVPDICLPVPMGRYHSLYIELKREKRSCISEEQKAWIYALNEQGHFAIVCKGCEQAIAVIRAYLNLGDGGGLLGYFQT